MIKDKNFAVYTSRCEIGIVAVVVMAFWGFFFIFILA